jgi:hypothetical protein
MVMRYHWGHGVGHIYSHHTYTDRGGSIHTSQTESRVGGLQAESTLSDRGLSHSGHRFTDDEGGYGGNDSDDSDDDDDDEDKDKDDKDGVCDDDYDYDYDSEEDEDEDMIAEVGSSSDDERYEMYG